MKLLTACYKCQRIYIIEHYNNLAECPICKDSTLRSIVIDFRFLR